MHNILILPYAGRHFSSIDDSMRCHAARQLLKERRSTFSGSNLLTVVMPPHPEHPAS